MEAQCLGIRKIQQILAPHFTIDQVQKVLDSLDHVPSRKKSGILERKLYPYDVLASIGPALSPFNKLSGPKVVTFFTTKGGVLKTTLAFNLARVSALYGLRVLAIGLDIQGDLTNTLGSSVENNDEDELAEVLKRLNQTPGLYDYFVGRLPLADLIQDTDIPGLSYIPETPELAALNEAITSTNRREFWLKEKVVAQLSSQYDLIVFDCGPHWNKLTTNALVASDLLVSPVECKINNFRNFKFFNHFLKEFSQDMRIDLETLFVPTKYSVSKRLAREIYHWYQDNLSQCSRVGIRESLPGEEAQALKISLIEHRPASAIATELRQVIGQIFERLANQHREQERELWPSA